jgi:hypothetical protein
MYILFPQGVVNCLQGAANILFVIMLVRLGNRVEKAERIGELCRRFFDIADELKANDMKNAQQTLDLSKIVKELVDKVWQLGKPK